MPRVIFANFCHIKTTLILHSFQVHFNSCQSYKIETFIHQIFLKHISADCRNIIGSESQECTVFFQGKEVPITVQLLYIGFFGLIVAVLCEFVDENDRFFTSQITEIPLSDIGVAFGVGCVGKYFTNICLFSAFLPVHIEPEKRKSSKKLFI